MSELKVASTTEEIIENPTAYGMPTFEEFKRKRHIYMRPDDEALSSADVGSSFLPIRKQIYEFKGYRCKNLEEVQNIASREGIAIRDLIYEPELIWAGCGKHDVIVRFISKQDKARRDQWK